MLFFSTGQLSLGTRSDCAGEDVCPAAEGDLDEDGRHHHRHHHHHHDHDDHDPNHDNHHDLPPPLTDIARSLLTPRLRWRPLNREAIGSET